MFGWLKSSPSRARKTKFQPRPRSRTLRLESLERRELMSVAPPTINGVVQTAKVISAAQISTVYWGQDFKSNVIGAMQPGQSDFNVVSNEQQIDTYLATLANSGFMDLMGQYGVGRGTFIGHDIVSNSSSPTDFTSTGAKTTVTETQITNMLQAEITAGRLTVNSNSVFAVVLPPDVQSQRDVTSGWAAHHWDFTDSQGAQVNYIVLPNPIGNSTLNGALGTETTFQFQTEALSHEVAETVTDPDVAHGTGWMDRASGSLNGDEIGDIPQDTLTKGSNCVGIYDGYMIQELWSNSANASVMPPSADANFVSQGGSISQITTITDNAGQGRVFGIGSDGQVYTNGELPNGSWTGWQELASLGFHITGSLKIANRATSIIATDDAQGWRVFAIVNGNAWTIGAQESSWTNLGGNCLQVATGTNSSTGNLELFAIGTDHLVYKQAAHGAGAAGFSGDVFAQVKPSSGTNAQVQSLSISRNRDGREELFGIGATDHAVWTIEQTSANGAWGIWQDLNGWASQIALGTTTDGRLEVYAIGSDNAVWVRRQSAPDVWNASTAPRLPATSLATSQQSTTGPGVFTGWTSLGGDVSEITVGYNADGREEVIARRAGDNAIMALTQTYANDSWTSSVWTQTGGYALHLTTFTNTVTLNIFGFKIRVPVLNMAVIGTDNALWTVSTATGGWY